MALKQLTQHHFKIIQNRDLGVQNEHAHIVRERALKAMEFAQYFEDAYTNKRRRRHRRCFHSNRRKNGVFIFFKL